MIWDSCDWKEPLLEMANRLNALTMVNELSDENVVQVEKDILIGFYSIRKLIESVTKLADSTRQMKIQVDCYLSKKPSTLFNCHNIHELYELENKTTETRDLVFICGRIIHSCTLLNEVTEDGGLNGIFFTSERDKNKRLYSMRIDKVIDIFRSVGKDYPVSSHWTKDIVTGEETFKIS